MRRLCLLLALAACGGAPEPPAAPGSPGSPPKPPAPGEKPGIPDRVVYDQILIAFQGSYKHAYRTREQARALAYSIYERVKAGFDFEALKREYTDARDGNGDPEPPIRVAGRMRHRIELGEVPWKNLLRGPGELVFRLEVGDVGIVDYHPADCNIGWLILKRLE